MRQSRSGGKKDNGFRWNAFTHRHLSQLKKEEEKTLTRILRPGECRVNLKSRKMRMMEKNSRISALSTWWASSWKVFFFFFVNNYTHYTPPSAIEFEPDRWSAINKIVERINKRCTRLQEHVGVEWERCHQIDDVDGRLQKIAFVRTEISDEND